MSRINFSKVCSGFALAVLSLILYGCASSAKSRYWGKTETPKDDVLRYISGSEPESLDPQVPTGQPEARMIMALYDGLVDYHPKTQLPIPAIAKSWDVSPNVDEFIFHLRDNAKWSDGTPITANDFVYSLRRGFAPETLSRTAELGYFIKYAEAFNGNQVFIKKNDQFLLAKDFAEDSAAPPKTDSAENKNSAPASFGQETDFRKFIKSPDRLYIDGDTLKRAQTIEANPKIKEVFKLSPSDLKNASALANKIKDGSDNLSKFLASNLSAEALSCANESACDDGAKQRLADGLNKIADTDLFFTQNWFAGLRLTEEAQKLAAHIEKENEERAKANKKLLTKLFYANRFALEQNYIDEIASVTLIPVKGEDIGVEAIDNYTLRITLRQPVPFFVGLLGHQFFRLVPRQAIEKSGKNWTRQENIVTCGAFKIKEIRPYDAYILVKDPDYWDAANVHLDGIEFYPIEDTSTQMNLYRAGTVDALYNHTVPASWIDEIRQYKSEYMDYPENATAYYSMNMTKPPFNDAKVRQAFNLSVNREALSEYRKVTKPLYFQSPSGIFPAYDQAMQKVGEEIRQERGISPEDWAKLQKKFDPELARKLLAEAGFPVQQNGSAFSCPTFPTDKVSLTYNTTESNRQIAEFVQNQWKQNLGITIPLKNMEFKTFLPMRNAMDFDGFAQSLWSGDYMDPYTFLGLHYGKGNNGAAGFYDPKYDRMLDDANRELDPQKRYEKLARAEYYLLDQVPSVPLTINATSWMKKPYVKGMYPNPGTLFPWKFVYIEPDPNKWDQNGEAVMSESDPRIEEQLRVLESTQNSAANAR